MSENRLYYSVQEVQKLLGISRPTVYRLLSQRKFQWIRIGAKGYRIDRSDFDRWIGEAMKRNANIIADKTNASNKTASFEELCDVLSRSCGVNN